MKDKIYYIKPGTTELEVRYAVDAAANDWGSNSPSMGNLMRKMQ
jgi:hypothetical protein